MSAELETLQALIKSLSADIDLQKTVLKDLEHRKSAALGKLNAIRDPMARLPLEISSEIFLWQCTPDSPDSRPPKPTAREAPMLLLNVCKAWSAIAVSTPMLWNNINIGVPGAQVLLDTWLHRANKYPLSIALSHTSLNHDVAAVLGKHAEQVKRMEIYEGVESDLDMPVRPPRYMLHQVITHLSRVPHLVECTLHDVFRPTENILCLPPARIQPLFLPCLRSLDLRSTYTAEGSGEKILKYLTLPALEALTLPWNTAASADTLAFLSRSSPPLQRLDLGRGRNRFSTLSELDGFLCLAPSLTYLALYLGEGTFIEDFFGALAAAPALFLPNLRSLEVQHKRPLSAPAYRIVLHALSIRSPQLVRVKLRCDTQDLVPGVDVGHGWKQLAADGMEVHIGTEEINFLSL
ncbi:hypothetical protein DFH06DRAFT_1187638 [Mycena polygramma]|nr:hypothetical protein DFH06DRAFT_1187638 [Mycena polygramma]